VRSSAPRRRALIAGSVALLAAFVALSVVAHAAGRGTGVDHGLLGWITGHHRDGLTTAADVLTTAASPTSTGLLAVVAAVLWWIRFRRVAPALVIVVTVWAANGIAVLAKRVVAEQRPPGSRQLLLGVAQSFPSGHVTGTLAVLGIIAVILGRQRSAAVKLLLGVLVAVVDTAVALSRLYLGVHWLTDVAGGLLLGGAAVLAGSAVLASGVWPTCSRVVGDVPCDAELDPQGARRVGDGDEGQPARVGHGERLQA
jgi:undecaprenyl-diphosphatase